MSEIFARLEALESVQAEETLYMMLGAQGNAEAMKELQAKVERAIPIEFSKDDWDKLPEKL